MVPDTNGGPTQFGSESRAVAPRPSSEGPGETTKPPKERSGEAARPATNDAAPAPRRRWPLRLLALVIVAGLAGGAYWRYHALHPPEDASQLVLLGNIDVRQVNLGFKVDGRIATLAVDEGDATVAGQVIATLDKRYFDDDLRLAKAHCDNAAAVFARLEHGSRPEEVDEARAQVAEQRATVARARQDFERAERLIGQGAVSRENFDQSKAALDEAEARLKYLELALRLAEIGPRQEDVDAGRADLAAQEAAVVQAERRLADSDLLAPANGVILTRARERGAIVAAGETVFTLTLASPVWVRTYVNERDLGRIEPDLPADVTTDSAPGKIYHGKIGFISPTAEFTPKTVETRELRTDLVYRLRVIVDNPDGGLRQGMPVTVAVHLKQEK